MSAGCSRGEWVALATLGQHCLRGGRAASTFRGFYAGDDTSVGAFRCGQGGDARSPSAALLGKAFELPASAWFILTPNRHDGRVNRYGWRVLEDGEDEGTLVEVRREFWVETTPRTRKRR